jgi:hypothetical protein
MRLREPVAAGDPAGVARVQPANAARVLRSVLRDHRGDLTVADAAARSGLPLRHAETGLLHLAATYPSHLAATSEGELLFRFPTGFDAPRSGGRLTRALAWMGRVAAGAAKLTARLAVTAVLFGFAAVFAILLFAGAIALSFAAEDSSPAEAAGYLAWGILEACFEALYWTLHFGWVFDPGYQVEKKKRGAPLYRKVNQFFFGPAAPAADERAIERTLLAEIRSKRGRIGVRDVMRVTGMPLDRAEATVARLLLDHDGTVEVGDGGAITYHFRALRRTATRRRPRKAPKPVWTRREELPPLTGDNRDRDNALVLGITLFNGAMGYLGISLGLPLVIGLVPFLLALGLLLIPIGRALARPLQRRRVERENGRRALLREVLSAAAPRGADERTLLDAWEGAAGRPLAKGALSGELLRIGAMPEVDGAADGSIRYRFPELEEEQATLEAEREAASESERSAGDVVFTSDDQR